MQQWYEQQQLECLTAILLQEAVASGSIAPDDPEDPLELGLHTVPMLRRDQSLCARVGSCLPWKLLSNSMTRSCNQTKVDHRY